MPFIARYRKEVTGSLDDGQLRTLEDRLGYLRELDQRRSAVLASIEEQGKPTDDLKDAPARRGHQGARRGHLPAFQTQAPHQGADRAGGGRAARRPPAVRPTVVPKRLRRSS